MQEINNKSYVQEVNGKEYMQNGKGALVPVDTISDFALERENFIREIYELAQEENKRLKALKTRILGDVISFVDLSAERYGEKLGGDKGNLTLSSFDGSIKVSLSIADRIAFDESIALAQQLINECIRDWAQNSNANLQVLVEKAFKMNDKGGLNAYRVLELRNYEVIDARWAKAMDIITKSIVIQSSKQYVRVHTRDENGGFNPVVLDIAGV